MALASIDGLRQPSGLPLLRHLQVGTLAVFRALQLGDMLCAIPA